MWRDWPNEAQQPEYKIRGAKSCKPIGLRDKKMKWLFNACVLIWNAGFFNTLLIL